MDFTDHEEVRVDFTYIFKLAEADAVPGALPSSGASQGYHERGKCDRRLLVNRNERSAALTQYTAAGEGGARKHRHGTRQRRERRGSYIKESSLVVSSKTPRLQPRS